VNLAELAAAAERLPVDERLQLLERIARSLRRDLGEAAAALTPSPGAASVTTPPVEAGLDDAELEELIAETLFEDLG